MSLGIGKVGPLVLLAFVTVRAGLAAAEETAEAPAGRAGGLRTSIRLYEATTVRGGSTVPRWDAFDADTGLPAAPRSSVWQVRPRALTGKAGQTRGVRRQDGIAPFGDSPFSVQILTSSMHATIGMHPDTYYADEPLRIRVTSTLPGWELTLKSTHLTPNGAGDRIDASEVYWAPVGGEMQDLQVFRQLVVKGRKGVTLVEAPIALVTRKYHNAAQYCGELFIGAQKPGGGKSPLQKVPFCTEVGYYASHSYRNHKMYFHFGHPDEALSGVMDGEVTAECRVSLSLSVSDGRVDKLPLGHGMTESVPADATVPLSWRLRESGGLFREPDYQSWNGREVSWSLSGTPGAVQYDLECAVEPGDFQPPGDYGMAITVTLQPVL